MKKYTLVVDVYETLMNNSGISDLLCDFCPEKGLRMTEM